MSRLFVFGLGYSARAVVNRMRPKLDAVWGTTRNPAKRDEIAELGVVPLLFDGEASPPPLRGRVGERGREKAVAVSFPPFRLFPARGERALLSDADHVLISIPPDTSGDSVLRCFGEELTSAKLHSLVYFSTVGVYGDHGGAWVDEESECRPVSERSRLRLDAEAAWQRFADESGIPVAVIRLAGIYGPGRGPFEKVQRGTARRIVKPGQVFNRIHVDDIAAIVEAAFDRRANGIFNGVDDEPAPPEDVLAYAADLLGLPPPPEVRFERAELTPMARSFYAESKRVRNGKIKRELGVRLAYPTYREGLKAVLEADGTGRR
ncbi:MAG: SDR family oxidoreductase [Propylenella sp.]